jgi:integrase
MAQQGAQPAKRLRKKITDEVAAGRTPGNARMTVEAYWKVWREGPLRSGDRKASTVALHTTVMRQHVIPTLGGMRLANLSAGHVERMLAGMVTQRGNRGRPKGSPVSGKTRRTAHAVLSLMLGTAVRDGLLPANVCEQVNRPTPGTGEAEYLSAEQLREVLSAVKGTRVHPLVLLLASTGLRIGEALGLRWRDVDVDPGLLRVTRTVSGYGSEAVRTSPKSLRSRRTLPIPPEVVTALTSWRATQAADRLRAGSLWHVGEHDWIFTTASGHGLDARNAARQYERALADKKVTGVPARFHMLRHTAASLMLGDAQVPLRVASEVLGHGSTGAHGRHLRARELRPEARRA